MWIPTPSAAFSSTSMKHRCTALTCRWLQMSRLSLDWTTRGGYHTEDKEKVKWGASNRSGERGKEESWWKWEKVQMRRKRWWKEEPLCPLRLLFLPCCQISPISQSGLCSGCCQTPTLSSSASGHSPSFKSSDSSPLPFLLLSHLCPFLLNG